MLRRFRCAQIFHEQEQHVSVLFLLFFWCPCMAINVSVQYNGGLLPDIIYC